jgi:TPR repeat protein
MKSCIAFIITLATCFSPVFAETTVELIQQRAEAGDATAQTLMGLMTYYGYQVPRDANISESWFQQAADQGDSYASERVVMAQKNVLIQVHRLIL